MASLQKTYALDTAAVLAGHAALLSDGLARPGDLAAFHGVAAVLPTFCHAGFECPLGDDAPGLDFLHCLRRAEESRYLVEAPFADGAWGRLRRFGALWREGADGLDRVPSCWLEFDLRGRAAAEVPPPSLFVNVPATGAAGYDAAVERACAALGVARSAAMRDAMARTYEVLGPVSSACETGFWLSRPTAAVRMVFTRVRASSPDELAGLLARAGHPAPSVVRRGPVAALWPASGSVAVGVDVTDGIAPGCAVEVYPLPPERVLPAEFQAEAQRRLFGDLVAAGLCTGGKAARVTGWPGSVGYGEDPGLDARIQLRRGINHVKLGVGPGRPASAKAYLSLSGVALRRERTDHAPS